MHSALKVIEVHLAVKKFVFYDAKSSYCLLCLKEKYLIINYPHKNFLLNKRSWLIGKCGHVNKILETVAR